MVLAVGSYKHLLFIIIAAVIIFIIVKATQAKPEDSKDNSRREAEKAVQDALLSGSQEYSKNIRAKMDFESFYSYSRYDKSQVFAKYLSEQNKDTWLRYVLVPTINDDLNTLIKWKTFSNSLNNVKKIEILPYHTLAIDKYKNLGIEYKLKDIPEPTKEQLTIAQKILLKGEIKQ